VTDEQIREIWELMKFAPTASNSNPLRVVVLKSDDARARLVPLMAPGNAEKTRTAPATVILAADTRFHEHLPALTPHVPANTPPRPPEMLRTTKDADSAT
jgi:nitroreductase